MRDESRVDWHLVDKDRLSCNFLVDDQLLDLVGRVDVLDLVAINVGVVGLGDGEDGVSVGEIGE